MGIKHYLEEHATEFTIQDYSKICHLLAKVVDNHVDDHIEKIKRKIVCIINDGHYTKETAEEDVAKMYYEDNGKRYAPYWDFNTIEEIYKNYKKDNPILSIYNVYDFYVTLNMIKSDNYKLYKKRFNGYSESQLNNLFIEDTINWLDDLDNPYGEHKIWKYLND